MSWEEHSLLLLLQSAPPQPHLPNTLPLPLLLPLPPQAAGEEAPASPPCLLSNRYFPNTYLTFKVILQGEF